jgi:peptidoglycan/LPS O-acetylase OafA/YrhL
MPAASHENPRLDALTGIRFFAAFAVFNVHFFRPELWFPRVPTWLLNMRNAGDAGVFLFFMLSGFILSNAYSRITTASRDRVAFWIARFARIYPVYLLCFLWFAPFILGHRFSVEPPHIAAGKATLAAVNTLLLVQTWISPRLGISWNGPGWTLSVETAFYLAFPWFAVRLRRLEPRGLLAAVTGFFLLSVLMSAGTLALFPLSEFADSSVKRSPIFHFPTFLMGMALGFLFQKRPLRNRLHASLLTIAGIALTLLLTTGIGNPERFIPHTSIYLPAMAALLFGLASGGWPARLLSLPLTLLLGEASYTLYLMQFPLNATLLWIFSRFHFLDLLLESNAPPFALTPWYYLIILAAAIALSILIFRRYETPWRVRLRQSLGRLLLDRALPPPVIPGPPGDPHST